MTAYIERLEDWVARLGRWINRVEGWRVALAIVIGLLLLPTLPVLLALAVCLGLAMFVRVWLGEFVFLMRLRRDDFPAEHDKLIWVMLMVGLPPLGFYAFRTFREAHWPAQKGSSCANDLF